jgi:hypothetical protein
MYQIETANFFRKPSLPPPRQDRRMAEAANAERTGLSGLFYEKFLGGAKEGARQPVQPGQTGLEVTRRDGIEKPRDNARE